MILILHEVFFACPPPQGHSRRVDDGCHRGGEPFSRHVSNLLHFMDGLVFENCFNDLQTAFSFQQNAVCCRMSMRKAEFLHSRVGGTVLN